MRRLVLLVMLAAFGLSIVGCGANEMSNSDQAAKMSALHKAETSSQSKDGVKSE